MRQDRDKLKDLFTALQLASARSDVTDFEVLCGFNNQLLCLLEDFIKNAGILTSGRSIVEFCKEVTHLALRIQAPFFDRNASGVNHERWSYAYIAADRQAIDYVSSSLGRALCEAAPTEVWEFRRWTAGKTDEQMLVSASLKRELLVLTVRDFYLTVYVWCKEVFREGESARTRTIDGLLKGIDGTLGVLNRLATWKSDEVDALDALTEAIRPFTQTIDEGAIMTGHPHKYGNFGAGLEYAIKLARDNGGEYPEWPESDY